MVVDECPPHCHLVFQELGKQDPGLRKWGDGKIALIRRRSPAFLPIVGEAQFWKAVL